MDDRLEELAQIQEEQAEAEKALMEAPNTEAIVFEQPTAVLKERNGPSAGQPATGEHLNELESGLKEYIDEQIKSVFDAINLLQTASNDHIDTLSKQMIMNTHKAKVANDGVFKAKKQIGELDEKVDTIDLSFKGVRHDMREIKKLVEMLQAQTQARQMAELAKAEAEADQKSKADKEGKADSVKLDKNVESLLKRVDKLEKEKKELVKEDASEQKQIDALKKMIEGFTSKMNQVSQSVSNSPMPTGKLSKNQEGSTDDDYSEAIKNLQMQIDTLKDHKDSNDFCILLDKVHERLDNLEGNDEGNRTPKVEGQQSKKSSNRNSKLTNYDGNTDDFGGRIQNLELNVESMLNDVSAITQNKDKIQELLQKSASQLSPEEVAKLKLQVTECRAESTVLSHEVKIMEEKLADFAQMKRQMSNLAAAPSESDFMNLRNRMDLCEKNGSQLRKSLTDQEKKIKVIRASGTSNGKSGLSGHDTLEDVSDKLSQLRLEFDDNRDTVKKEIENHNRQLPEKVDWSDFEQLEGRMDTKIDDIYVQLQNTVTRDELTKKIKIINIRIKEIIEQMGHGHTQMDGMLSKKNLGPIACASCEKDLINMQGLPAEYHSWKGMPQREQGERIARYGQGFSKILSTLREDPRQKNNNTTMAPHQHDKLTLKHVQSIAQVKNRGSIDFNSDIDQYPDNSGQNATTVASHNHIHSGQVQTIRHDASHNTTIGFFKSGSGKGSPHFSKSGSNFMIDTTSNAEDRLRRKHNSVIRASNTGGSNNIQINPIYNTNHNEASNHAILSPANYNITPKHQKGIRSGSSLAIEITPKKLNATMKHKHTKSHHKGETPQFETTLPQLTGRNQY